MATTADRSAATVSSSTKTDVFAELGNGVRTLLSERAAFNVDRKAGLLQVTDFPERLDRVAVYLDAVQDRVHRQVQIDARVVEVELNDEKAAGVDWTAVAADRWASRPGASGRRHAASLTGLRVTDVRELLALLAAQGKVTALANPRLLTLNNEPAIVRTDSRDASASRRRLRRTAIVTLSLSPIVKAPAVAESDMLARVADGETLVHLRLHARSRDARAESASASPAAGSGARRS